jgi:hypothetical protein
MFSLFQTMLAKIEQELDPIVLHPSDDILHFAH